MPPKIDLTGKKFGRLTVIGPAPNSGKNTNWLCLCSCGTIKPVPTRNLRTGKTNSCGCLQREVATSFGHKNKKHFGKGTRLYNIWKNMRERCNNSSSTSFKNYGGKGIKVCKEWDSFVEFEHWALTHGYEENLSIDRIDNSKGYSPDNCRWANVEVQSRNRSTNIYYKGKCLSDWCKETGISLKLASNRLKAGWPFEVAITKPPRPIRLHSNNSGSRAAGSASSHSRCRIPSARRSG